MKPVSSKYGKDRISALKQFTDRDEPRKTFTDALSYLMTHPDEMNVINYYGIGGFGKTRLIKELGSIIRKRNDGTVENDRIVYVTYDFEDSTDKMVFISHVKNRLKKQGLEFPVTEAAEIAYNEKSGIPVYKTVSKEKLLDNPMISVASKFIPGASSFISTMKLGKQVLDEVSGYYDKLKKLWNVPQQEIEKDIRFITEMETGEINSYMPWCFARDLERNIENAARIGIRLPIVIFLDTYERLINSYDNKDYYEVYDEWLRNDIIKNLPGMLWVIGGREKLTWGDKDEFYAEIEGHELGDLTKKDAFSFLKAAEVDESLFEDIYSLTGGTPLFLDLSVNTYYEKMNRGEKCTREDFGVNREELIERFFRYMDSEDRNIAIMLAIVGKWTDKQIEFIGPKVLPNTFRWSDYISFIQHTIILKDNETRYYMHDSVKSVLINVARGDRYKAIMENTIENCIDYVGTLPENSTMEIIEKMDRINFLAQNENISTKQLSRLMDENFAAMVNMVDTYSNVSVHDSILRMVSVYQLKGDDSSIVKALMLKGLSTMRVKGDYFTAKEYFEEVLKITVDSPITYIAHMNIMRCDLLLGNNEEVVRRRNLDELSLKKLNKDRTTAMMLVFSASAYANLGKYDEAEKEMVLSEQYARGFSDSNYESGLLMVKNQIYPVLGKSGLLIDAYQKQLNKLKKELPETHPLVIVCTNDMGYAYMKMGEADKGIELIKTAYNLALKEYGEDNPFTVAMETNMASTLITADPVKGLQHSLNLYNHYKETNGADSQMTLANMVNIGYSLNLLEKYEERKTILEGARETIADKCPGNIDLYYKCLIFLENAYYFTDTPLERQINLGIKLLQLWRTDRSMDRSLLQVAFFEILDEASLAKNLNSDQMKMALDMAMEVLMDFEKNPGLYEMEYIGEIAGDTISIVVDHGSKDKDALVKATYAGEILEKYFGDKIAENYSAFDAYSLLLIKTAKYYEAYVLIGKLMDVDDKSDKKKTKGLIRNKRYAIKNSLYQMTIYKLDPDFAEGMKKYIETTELTDENKEEYLSITGWFGLRHRERICVLRDMDIKVSEWYDAFIAGLDKTGEDKKYYVDTLEKYAEVLFAQKDYERSEKACRLVLDLTDDAFKKLLYKNRLGANLYNRGHKEEGALLFKEVCREASKDSPEYKKAVNNLKRSYRSITDEETRKKLFADVEEWLNS